MTSHLPVALALLTFFSACTTPHRLLLDTGEGLPREFQPLIPAKPVAVDEAAFEHALERLVLESSLALQPPQQGWVVRTAFFGSPTPPRWQDLVSKSFGGLCAPGQPRHTCISMLDDLMGLSEWDKLGIALGLSFTPLRESIAQAVQDTLAPQLFYSVISVGVVSWIILAANPEPVFTKAAAVISAVMLIYLGVDVFLDVLKASLELRLATAQATTFEELEQASQRFGRRVGPQGVGVELSQAGQVSAVAVAANGAITFTLAPTAVAMTAQRPSNNSTDTPRLAGQEHHIISKKIADKLARHPTLSGRYTARDPRFKTRTADKESHNGYQKWHRDVDDEVIEWLSKYDHATPAEFEAFLRQIYNQPNMRLRFPDGF